MLNTCIQSTTHDIKSTTCASPELRVDVETRQAKMDNTMDKDMTGVKWSDPRWLEHFQLMPATALDYFSLSQFYDRTCNNELVKAQRLDPKLLTTLKGIEYGLEPCAPDTTVFVITKRRREISPPSLTTLAAYYIIDGEVFQAPSANLVLANRLDMMMHYLRKSFASVRDSAVLSPKGTYSWAAPASKSTVPKGPESGRDGGTAAENRAIGHVLFDVFDKNKRIFEAGRRQEEEAAKLNGGIDANASGQQQPGSGPMAV